MKQMELTDMGRWLNDYLTKQKGVLKEHVFKVYSNHINKFVEFLNMTQINKADSHDAITIDDVKLSVAYHKAQKKIGTFASMCSHVDSIKHFYEFLRKNNKVKYTIFDGINDGELKTKIAFACKLANTKMIEPIDPQVFREILSKLDQCLSVDYFKMHKWRRVYLNRITLRIFLHLTIVAPAKINTIYNIKFSDFKNSGKTLYINNTNIDIPLDLQKNISDAIKLRKAILNISNTVDERLLNYIGGRFKQHIINGWFDSFLCEFFERTYPLESVRKTVIKDLVSVRTNPYYIAKISGTNVKQIMDTYYKDIFEGKESELDALINDTVKNSTLYKKVFKTI